MKTAKFQAALLFALLSLWFAVVSKEPMSNCGAVGGVNTFHKIKCLACRTVLIQNMKCKNRPITGFLPISDTHETVSLLLLSAGQKSAKTCDRSAITLRALCRHIIFMFVSSKNKLPTISNKE